MNIVHRATKKGSTSSDSHSHNDKNLPKHRFAMSSLRGMTQPELSKKLFMLIKTENHAISAYEQAGRESHSVANQLSEWGESTDDDGVSDVSDKLGVLLAEIAEQEDHYAQNMEESRGVLKQIRNTESSVVPSRNHKAKIEDEIAKLKYKEPESVKLPGLEQELVRAEAQSLVAEAQLTNVTRQKFKEAFDLQTAAIIERAEKQLALAQHARRLINILDDTPIVPGEVRPAFAHEEEGREILNDAERSLKGWVASIDPIPSNAGKIGANAMAAPTEPAAEGSVFDPNQHRVEVMERAQQEAMTNHGVTASPTETAAPYPTTETTTSTTTGAPVVA